MNVRICEGRFLHFIFVYVVVNFRDVAFLKNHPEMVGLHFIRVFCFVRTCNKRIHVINPIVL